MGEWSLLLMIVKRFALILCVLCGSVKDRFSGLFLFRTDITCIRKQDYYT